MSAGVSRLIGGFLLSALVALGGSPAWSAENLQLRRCSKQAVVSDASGGGETLSDLSDSPAIVCSVDFIPTSNGGYVVLKDSPDDTVSHAQAVTVGEVGASTALNSNHAYYGELGRLTQFGLEVQVSNGTAIISWDN